MEDAIGQRCWVIPEGYIPPGSHGKSPEFTSHEALCVLNAGNHDAHLDLTIFYADREPVGPYRLTVPARRTRHFRFNDLKDPETIPLGTSYASGSVPSDRLHLVGGASLFVLILVKWGEKLQLSA
jgi:hypothetical protein